jgi:hypothetical protein
VLTKNNEEVSKQNGKIEAMAASTLTPVNLLLKMSAADWGVER